VNCQLLVQRAKQLFEYRFTGRPKREGYNGALEEKYQIDGRAAYNELMRLLHGVSK